MASAIESEGLALIGAYDGCEQRRQRLRMFYWLGRMHPNQCVCALASARWWAAPGVMREGGGFGAEGGDPLVPQQGVP